PECRRWGSGGHLHCPVPRPLWRDGRAAGDGGLRPLPEPGAAGVARGARGLAARLAALLAGSGRPAPRQRQPGVSTLAQPGGLSQRGGGGRVVRRVPGVFPSAPPASARVGAAASRIPRVTRRLVTRNPPSSLPEPCWGEYRRGRARPPLP